MAVGPVHVEGELLAVKRVGAYHVLTIAAAGVAERFRPGTFVSLALGGPTRADVLTRAFSIHRVRTVGGHGATVEVVAEAVDRLTRWLVAAQPGTRFPVTGPLGRPFALPKEPVGCLLVGLDAHAAGLFPLAERLRERGCGVHMVLGARTERHLFGALEARRSTLGVTVTTDDGSVGAAGGPADVVPDVLARTGTEVVYAAGPSVFLAAVAAAAERHGAWSQTAVAVPMPCGTGLCQGCVLPVVGEDGSTTMARACAEGPVFRGDRVRWADLGSVPADARGAAR